MPASQELRGAWRVWNDQRPVLANGSGAEKKQGLEEAFKEGQDRV